MAKKKAKKKAKTKKKSSKPRKKRASKESPSLGLLGTSKLHSPVRERISCGCSVLDAIMGGPVVTIGGATHIVPSDGTRATEWGVPVGRILEVVGGYGTGKTTFLETLARQVQLAGGNVYMGITEATLDPDRMVRLGCDPERIRYHEFEFIEEGFEWVINVLNSRLSRPNRAPDLITWDTVGASHPQDERPGSGSRAVREGLRKITNLVARADTIMVFVNQTSASFDRFETEPATPFGQGIRFHASIRIEFRGQKKFLEVDAAQRGGSIFNESKAAYGIEPVANCRKNKTFPPFRRCRMPVTFHGGIDDDFALYLYLSQKKSLVRTSAPQEGERTDLGPVITLRMTLEGPMAEEGPSFVVDYPVACYWNEYRSFLQRFPEVREWMVEECRKLAYNGFDPIAS